MAAMIDVVILDAARAELDALPEREHAAMDSALFKLRELGDSLGYPHSSAVKNAPGLRELRPRQGRSPVRSCGGWFGGGTQSACFSSCCGPRIGEARGL